MRPRFLKDQTGATTLWLLVWTIAFLGLGSLAVDSANAWRVRSQLQATADAAALAGAKALLDGADVETAKAEAQRLARLNMPLALHGEVLPLTAIEIGAWDAGTGRLDPEAAEPDAVRVRAGRAESNDNELGVFLAGILGKSSWDVVTSATAFAIEGANPCANVTIMTTADVIVAGSTELYDGVCVHGEKGVRANAGSNYYEPGVRLSAADIATVVVGHTRNGSAGWDEIAAETSMGTQLYQHFDAMFAALWGGLSNAGTNLYGDHVALDYGLPTAFLDGSGQATIVPVSGKSLPSDAGEGCKGDWNKDKGKGTWVVKECTLQPHTIYLVDGKVVIPGNVTAVQDVAIIARGDITISGWGGRQAFKNVFFFSEGTINSGGNNVWGDETDFCEEGEYGVYLFAKDTLSLGGSQETYGVIGASKSFKPGGGWTAAGGVYFESVEKVNLGGNAKVVGCDKQLASDFDIDTGGGQSVEGRGSLVR